ncbi:MAG: hypothetical protein EWV45_18380 [Microcystis flos-aquae Mf_QC_C_20070823_S10D]|uniref:Uncharacterized protein n=2 Tax=Microcystis TaxID=1125 RepID=A0A552AKG7_MICAE|nr:MAG: hypothetical protein EWV63_12145 [Microcystis aeruginosa Ma_OC_H_19870700_S124]TRT94603.1 MAG: hypothetical protein EWV65_16680 [Microcystis flos-aquae Ma_QC_C_20070823_S18D]TRV08190.1 MAG: hypothetical protein EWV45_18380 [Microcystis flos-aquae Mf_QC_C_20070823_S10D]TRV19480.1 MAG: hypothetical protein EWV72_21330 [Microcystis flos-aquae Mf_QC_C_20070823_S10]TRV28580.1 MAG: hypothetical protein EWV70_22920 [Microcystis flos-aquae Mf_QC_C_20070823_S20]TRV37425.1 MAG: hypothetical prot
MRNVNLNILKFVESIDNFCLSLTNIALGVSIQEIGVSESVFRSREIGFRCWGFGVLGFWGFSSISPLPPATRTKWSPPIHNS